MFQPIISTITIFTPAIRACARSRIKSHFVSFNAGQHARNDGNGIMYERRNYNDQKPLSGSRVVGFSADC